MLTEVANGVWVRQSAWVWTNSIVVSGSDGLILVDPGISGSELSQLADDVDRLGIPVVAGFSTHPHWDYLLWHPRFADVPRYATSDPAPDIARPATSDPRGYAAAATTFARLVRDRAPRSKAAPAVRGPFASNVP